jgi:hypothetical protein
MYLDNFDKNRITENNVKRLNQPIT